MVTSLSPQRFKVDNIHRRLHAFDLWASKQVLKRCPAAVIAYENSAYHTFSAAKAVGAKCILDLPSIERRVAEAIIPLASSGYSPEIAARKDAEIDMADLILTCSKFAATTYIDAGVPAEKIRWLQLGATIPSMLPPRMSSDPEELRLVFAGSFSFRKSADLILDVLERLRREGYRISLDIVGRIEDPSWSQRIRQASNINYLGQLPQSGLFRVLRNSDCLLLPSRFDSFGMVVTESLACGTPVIVSHTTGAKEIVEANAGVGWLVDATSESLYGCIVARWNDRNELSDARSAASRAAKQFTWEAYRYRVGEMLETWLAQHLRSPPEDGSRSTSVDGE